MPDCLQTHTLKWAVERPSLITPAEIISMASELLNARIRLAEVAAAVNNAGYDFLRQEGELKLKLKLGLDRAFGGTID